MFIHFYLFSSLDTHKIVENWMLWKRYKKEIVQTKTEIVQYLQYMTELIGTLSSVMQSSESSNDPDMIDDLFYSQLLSLKHGKECLIGIETNR